MGSGAWSRMSVGRRSLALAAGVALFAVVFAVRLASERDADAVGALFVLPVALLAGTLGLAAGLAAAGVAVVLLALAIELGGGDLLGLGNLLGEITIFLVIFLVGGWVGTAVDRRRAAERRLRALTEAVGDAVIAINARSEVIDWNRGAEAIFGWTAGEALGREVTFIMPEQLREAHLAGVARVLRTGRSELIGSTIDFVGVRKDGTEVPVELSIGSWTTGDATQFVAVVRDITERKDARRRLLVAYDGLARSNAELEKFGYAASHDLSEPLRTISGFAQLLDRRYHDRLGADAAGYIGFIVDGVAQMQSLIDGLLTYAQVGGQALECAAVDCNVLVDDVVTSLGGALHEAGAVVEVGPLPTVGADGDRLVQVFQNLVSNALKFRGDEPVTVEVSAARDNGAWRFSVRDNGIGIEPEFRDRVFDVFQRLHTRDEYPGTGIGLALCKRIVEQHGGRIWCEPTPEGGTTFAFTVPDVAGKRQ
jgi:PAS domain S-box-containing protein